MREIKFRFWNINLTEMYYGEDHWNGDRWYCVTGLGDIHVANEREVDLADDEVIPMEFTGLKDKNGKEIYEGDILRNTVHGGLGVVKWDYHSLDLLSERLAIAEIVGNIYQNPELADKERI